MNTDKENNTEVFKPTSKVSIYSRRVGVISFSGIVAGIAFIFLMNNFHSSSNLIMLLMIPLFFKSIFHTTN